MIDELNKEVQRVVGGTGVDVAPADDSGDESLVRIEMAESVHKLPAERLMTLLRDMPDDAGVMALRAALDREVPTT